MMRRTSDDTDIRPTGAGLAGARSILLGILSVEVAVLVVTGIALFFLYRPSASQAWNFVDTTSAAVRVSQALRHVHLLASRLAVPTTIAAAVVLILSSRIATARRWAGPAAGAGIVVSTLAASFTGFLLPWDQLALRAVTVDSGITGYRVLFGDTVRFVLLGGTEVSPGTVLTWLLVHMLVLGPALAVLLILAWRHELMRGSPKGDRSGQRTGSS